MDEYIQAVSLSSVALHTVKSEFRDNLKVAEQWSHSLIAPLVILTSSWGMRTCVKPLKSRRMTKRSCLLGVSQRFSMRPAMLIKISNIHTLTTLMQERRRCFLFNCAEHHHYKTTADACQQKATGFNDLHRYFFATYVKKKKKKLHLEVSTASCQCEGNSHEEYLRYWTQPHKVTLSPTWCDLSSPQVWLLSDRLLGPEAGNKAAMRIPLRSSTIPTNGSEYRSFK